MRFGVNSKIGIIILNYNHSEFTIRCIQSILERETFLNYELVVVDNNSSIIEQKVILQEKLPKSVHLILNSINAGYSAGNNIGCRYAIEQLSCGLVLILNNDTLFHQPILYSLIDALNTQKDMVAVSPAIDEANFYQPDRQVRRLVSLRDMVICNTSLLHRLWFTKNIVHQYHYRDYVPYNAAIYKSDTINGAAFLIDAQFLVTIGYFDENTFLFYEELILGHQISLFQKHCGLDCRVHIEHLQGISTGAKKFKIPYKMFEYSQKSFKYLLVMRYNASSKTIWGVLLYRKLEFHIKRLYQWMK